MSHKLNADLDLISEITGDISPEKVWRGWTEPEILKKWFCPLPWKTVDCRIDLHPGGEFMTVMHGPNGEIFSNSGCYLEIIPGKKLVWTSALLPNFRPATMPQEGFAFTTTIFIEPHLKGSKYTVITMHKDKSDCEKHRKMGFKEVWGKAFEQLVELGKSI